MPNRAASDMKILWHCMYTRSSTSCRSPVLIPASSWEFCNNRSILRQGKIIFWQAKAETAGRVHGRIESVLQWAKIHGLREGENPADWKTLKFTLPSKSKVYKEENYPAFPYAEIGMFMAEL